MQIAIFFSLLASIVTDAYPEDEILRVLLPGILLVPPILALMFEAPLGEQFHRWTGTNRQGFFGRCVLWCHRALTLRVDSLYGVKDGGQGSVEHVRKSYSEKSSAASSLFGQEKSGVDAATQTEMGTQTMDAGEARVDESRDRNSVHQKIEPEKRVVVASATAGRNESTEAARQAALHTPMATQARMQPPPSVTGRVSFSLRRKAAEGPWL